MPYQLQFRTYAECCLRAAELSDAPEQKESLIATASAWHLLAQKLEMRDGLINNGQTARNFSNSQTDFGGTGLRPRHHSQACAYDGWRRDRNERAGQGLSVHGAAAGRP
jgi:hypothetical protein